MTEKIAWQTEIKAALALAKDQKKKVLVDFFNPG